MKHVIALAALALVAGLLASPAAASG